MQSTSKKKEKTYPGWFLVGFLVAIVVFLAIALMFSSLRIQKLGAEIQTLQAEHHPRR